MSQGTVSLQDRQTIATWLPHGESMCLLESVEHWDAEQIECRGLAPDDSGHPLRREGVVAPVHAIEYAAQAAAVHGALAANEGEAMGRPGMIASVRDVRWSHTASVLAGGPLRITCTVETIEARFCRYSFAVSDSAGCSVMGRIMIVFGDG